MLSAAVSLRLRVNPDLLKTHTSSRLTGIRALQIRLRSLTDSIQISLIQYFMHLNSHMHSLTRSQKLPLNGAQKNGQKPNQTKCGMLKWPGIYKPKTLRRNMETTTNGPN